MKLTMTFEPSFVHAGATDEDIMDDSEDTFASYPPSILIFDLAVVEYCRFV